MVMVMVMMTMVIELNSYDDRDGDVWIDICILQIYMTLGMVRIQCL